MRDKVVETIRMMALERAKGELQSARQCYWGDDERSIKHNKILLEIIKKIKDELE